MTIYEEYACIELEIATLEEKKTELRAKVSAELEKDGGKTSTNFGTFFFQVRKSWKYSDKVKTEEDKIKGIQEVIKEKVKPEEQAIAKIQEVIVEIKKTEEEDGSAKCEEKKSLTFKPTK